MLKNDLAIYGSFVLPCKLTIYSISVNNIVGILQDFIQSEDFVQWFSHFHILPVYNNGCSFQHLVPSLTFHQCYNVRIGEISHPLFVFIPKIFSGFVSFCFVYEAALHYNLSYSGSYFISTFYISTPTNPFSCLIRQEM